MDITYFKECAHKICDRWYFKQTEDELQMWERPYKRGPGFEKDYMVLPIPLAVLCKGQTSQDYLVKKLQGLKWNHEQRMLGNQVQQVKDMEARNAQRKQNKRKDFSRETKAWAKDTRKVFKKLGEETLGTNIQGAAITANYSGESYNSAKKQFNQAMAQRQGVA